MAVQRHGDRVVLQVHGAADPGAVELEVVAAGGRADLAQLGVDEGAVVALVVVLEHHLPVAGQVVGVAGQGDEPRRLVGGDQLVEGADVLGERRGVAGAVDEQEPVPALQRQLDQAVLAGSELGVVAEPRGCPQGPVQVVGPGVVGAEHGPPAGLLAHPEQLVAAVAAGVGEGPHPPVGPPDQQHPGPADPHRPLGAGGLQVALAAHAGPGPGEEAFLLEGEHPRRGVGVPGEHAALAERLQGRLEVDRVEGRSGGVQHGRTSNLLQLTRQSV